MNPIIKQETPSKYRIKGEWRRMVKERDNYICGRCNKQLSRRPRCGAYAHHLIPLKSGGGINNDPKNNGSNNGPLRKIVGIIYNSTGMFSQDTVFFDCGHKGTATPGAIRGRCRECKKEIDAALEELK